MNFQPLYTTARVLRATYQVVSTALLLYYLSKRIVRSEVKQGLPRSWD